MSTPVGIDHILGQRGFRPTDGLYNQSDHILWSISQLWRNPGGSSARTQEQNTIASSETKLSAEIHRLGGEGILTHTWSQATVLRPKFHDDLNEYYKIGSEDESRADDCRRDSGCNGG